LGWAQMLQSGERGCWCLGSGVCVGTVRGLVGGRCRKRQASSAPVVLAGEVTGKMPVPLLIRGQGSWGVREGGLGEPQIFGMDADAAEW